MKPHQLSNFWPNTSIVKIMEEKLILKCVHKTKRCSHLPSKQKFVINHNANQSVPKNIPIKL